MPNHIGRPDISDKIAKKQLAVSVIGEKRRQEVADLSFKVFGRKPKRMAFPGGKSRNTYVVDMGDDTFVFAKREKPADASLEATILKTLSKTGRVPRLKAIASEWVVQEHLTGTRLPVLLNSLDSMLDRHKAVDLALESLLEIHEAARSADLYRKLPVIGANREWFWNRTGAAKRMSKDLGISEPNIDREFMVRTLFGKRDDFIKYDARPGNALIDGGQAYWFDWEDCGLGCALEDLAFVLCDEWMMIDEDAESALIEKFLPLFNRGLSKDQAHEHLMIYGVMHSVIRLRMALKYRLRDEGWWDRDHCLEGDKVGVTSSEVQRLCIRCERWAEPMVGLRPLVSWFDEVGEKFNISVEMCP